MLILSHFFVVFQFFTGMLMFLFFIGVLCIILHNYIIFIGYVRAYVLVGICSQAAWTKRFNIAENLPINYVRQFEKDFKSVFQGGVKYAYYKG